MTHTSAPWSYSPQSGRPNKCFQGQVWDSFGNSLAIIEALEVEEQATANARLIAAAPELLEALEDTLSCIADINKHGRGKFDIDKAQTAINKAKGNE